MIRKMFHVIVVARPLSCGTAGAAGRTRSPFHLDPEQIPTLSVSPRRKAKAKELGTISSSSTARAVRRQELSNVEDALNQNVKALLLDPVVSAAARRRS